MFNGTDLSGWEAVGTGNWTVENGDVVARCDPGESAGGRLVSLQDYGDYKLRLKFKMVSETGDAGVLFRDPRHGKTPPPAFKGYELQICVGDDLRNTTGAIHDVARSYFKEMDRSKWTEFEVHCDGDHLVAYMDGKKTAETHNRRSYKGAIGLQIQGISKKEVHCRWKDVEIMVLPDASRDSQYVEEKLEQAPGEYVDLFAGKTLEGDFAVYWGDPADWTLKDGVLRGEDPVEDTNNEVLRNGKPPKKSWLFTKQGYSDFILSAEFRICQDGNGGIVLRFPWPADGDNRQRGPTNLGYEIQICEANDDEVENPTGSIYLYARAYTSDSCRKEISRSGKWNQCKIYAKGDHIVTYVNGRKTAETHNDKRSEGRIGFQTYASNWLEYRNIKIKVIK